MVSIRGRRLLTVLIGVAAFLAMLVVALVVFVSVFQERIAFQPQGPPYPAVDDSIRVNYSAADGQKLFAYIVGKAPSANGILIAFHGNADMAAYQVEWAEEIARRVGLRVMLAEYRGYAGLTGRPGYAASKLDADAAYDFARDTLAIPPGRIALFGHSLGTAIATELATRHPPFALLLQSPFTSARDMAQVLFGRRPGQTSWNLVSRIHFNTVENVSHIDAPVSVVHGGRDRLIPVEMGKEVYSAAKSKGEWLVIPEASHNDVALRGGERYWQWISRSLDQGRKR